MHVEFLGIPRERVGLAEVTVEAATFGELLQNLSARFSGFADLMEGRQLHSSVAASLNGDTFVSDPQTPLGDDDRLLILSADVGG